ncbi:MAG: hypothetical protein ACYDAB_07960 [bacterium]
MSKQTPLYGEIVSVYHLHHSSRVDGSATLVQMERVPDEALPAHLADAGASLVRAAGPGTIVPAGVEVSDAQPVVAAR